jgi:hypothetical protein
MPEAVALPAPDPEPRRKRGHPPFIPTPEQRQVIAALAAFGISQKAMVELLRREGVPCVSDKTLVKAFRDELKHGRELMISALGTRMYDIAMSDRPNAYNALCFLLRTFGGPAWRVADAKDEVPPPPETGVAMIFPRPEMTRAEEPTPPTIEAEADAPAELGSATAQPNDEEGWVW